MSEMDGEPEDGPDRDEVPIGRAIACMATFGLWSVVVATLHAVLPSRVDLISVVVGESAAVPVLFLLFRNVELGFGDWKLAATTNRIQKAFEKLDSLEVRLEPVPPKQQPTPGASVAGAATAQQPAQRISSRGIVASTSLAQADDDVVFIRLRREIELRLRKIAAAYDVPKADKMSAARLLADLTARKVIGGSEAQGIAELIAAGNAQAHSASIKPGAAELARTDGSRLLLSLDRLALIPEEATVLDIARRAQTGDKDVRVDDVIQTDDSAYFPDAFIPDELVIEVKRIADPPRVRTGVVQVERTMQGAGFGAGLLILGSKPDGTAIAAFEQARRGANIGVAWSEGGKYDGDERAHTLAPWLFAD